MCLFGPRAASRTCQLVHFLLTRTCTYCSCCQQWAREALTPGPIPMAGNWSHSLFSWQVGPSTCPYGGTQSLLVLWTHRCLCPRNLQFLVLKFSHSSLLSCWHYRCSCWHYRPPTCGLHSYCTQTLKCTHAPGRELEIKSIRSLTRLNFQVQDVARKVQWSYIIYLQATSCFVPYPSIFHTLFPSQIA